MAKDEIKDFYCSGTHAYNRTKLCPTNYLCVNMTAMNLTLENGTVKEIQPSYCEFMIK